MRELRTCLVCSGPKHDLLYEATYHGTPHEAYSYFLADRKASAHGEIRRCADCGFVFTARQFDEEEYDQIYSRVGGHSGAPSRGATAAATRARFERLKTIIAAHADFGEPFLDFGCGNGDFLRAVGSAAGTGFEVGAPCGGAGPAGSRVVAGSWPTVAGSDQLPWGSQNLVTAFDVFEHLCNLERDVELIHRVLRPGGTLFVTVPDVESRMARMSGRRWNMLLLEHLWYFSGTTLDHFLSRYGFAPLLHCAVPYDATVGHIVKRLGEALRLRLPHLPSLIGDMVISTPAGVLLAGYRRQVRTW